MSHAKQQMIEDMHNVASLGEGTETKKFLSEAICSDLVRNIKCNTVDAYEAAGFVIWRGTKLVNYVESEYELLSDVQYPYVEMVLYLLESYLPEIRLTDFDLLDQRLWNSVVQIDENTVKSKTEAVMKELKVETPRGIGYKKIGKEMFNLIHEIRNMPDWCKMFESTPSMFWANIMRNDALTINPTVKQIIRSALAIPAGSAAAERSFGMMNYIKTSQRANLNEENINHIVRIRHNGPITGALNLEPYAKKFVESHERCDPLHDTTGKMKKKTAGEPMEEEHIHSTIF